MSSTTLLDLPTDVLTLIFKHQNSIHDILSLSNCNRQLREVYKNSNFITKRIDILKIPYELEEYYVTPAKVERLESMRPGPSWRYCIWCNLCGTLVPVNLEAVTIVSDCEGHIDEKTGIRYRFGWSTQCRALFYNGMAYMRPPLPHDLHILKMCIPPNSPFPTCPPYNDKLIGWLIKQQFAVEPKSLQSTPMSLPKALARSWVSGLIASLSCFHQSSKSSFDHECLKSGCLMKSPREHWSVRDFNFSIMDSLLTDAL